MQHYTRSLSDLKEIGCKTVGTVHIPPLSWAIERLLPGEIVEICPRSADFSLRFFKSDRLLGVLADMGYQNPVRAEELGGIDCLTNIIHVSGLARNKHTKSAEWIRTSSE